MRFDKPLFTMVPQSYHPQNFSYQNFNNLESPMGHPQSSFMAIPQSSFMPIPQSSFMAIPQTQQIQNHRDINPYDAATGQNQLMTFPEAQQIQNNRNMYDTNIGLPQSAYMISSPMQSQQNQHYQNYQNINHHDITLSAPHSMRCWYNVASQPAGEGDIIPIQHPDGTLQFYFVPRLLYPQSPGHSPCFPNSKTYCLGPAPYNSANAWLIKSIANPVPHLWTPPPIFSPQDNLTLPPRRKDLLPLHHQVLFHNDRVTSTTDLEYFFPNLHSTISPISNCTQTIQLEPSMSSSNHPTTSSDNPGTSSNHSATSSNSSTATTSCKCNNTEEVANKARETAKSEEPASTKKLNAKKKSVKFRNKSQCSLCNNSESDNENS